MIAKPQEAVFRAPQARTSGAWLFAGCIAIVVLCGVFFRLDHVERKVYWDDEVFTSLRVAGITERELVADAAAFHDVAALRAIVHPGRNRLRPITATLTSLVAEDAQHSPLYYSLARLWAGLFGDSIAALRALSVVFGILALPCMYWLCVELFASRAAAWLGVALVGASPFEVLYAQQAREYSLWTLTTLVVCALFLRAARSGLPSAWASYCLVLAVDLYVYPLSISVAGAGLAYLALTAWRRPRTLAVATIATVTALALYAPWLVTIWAHFEQINRSMAVLLAPRPAPFIVREIMRLFQLSIIDLGAHARELQISYALAALTVCAALGFASVSAYRSRDRSVWPYIACLIIASLVPLTAADLVWAGNRTGQPRFATPMYLGIDLALVYVFTVARNRIERSPSEIAAWAAAFAAIFVVRIGSCAVSGAADTWWTTYDLQAIPAAASINARPHPILISDNYLVWSLVLSNYLRPDIAVQLRPRCYICTIDNAQGFALAKIATTRSLSDVFVLGPSPALSALIARAVGGTSHAPPVHCIDIRNECPGGLRFFPVADTRPLSGNGL